MKPHCTEPSYYQLMHIMLKSTELLKHSKINKNAPTCFGLHRNHFQGATVGAWLVLFSSYVPTDGHTKRRMSRGNFISGRQGL